MKPRLTAAAFAIGLAFSMPSYGDSSGVSIGQFGESNNATIDQSASPGSFASILQFGDHNGTWFDGVDTIEQHGNTNSGAGLFQSGNHNLAFMQQFGQNGSGASVNQIGNSNRAGVSQGSGGNNAGWVFQGGFACLSRECGENERIDNQGASANNTAFVTQFNGSGNTGIVAQGGGPFNSGNISQQNGDGNNALVRQSGEFNNGFVQQGGFLCDSEGCVDAGGSNSSRGSLTQSGFSQQGMIRQFGTATAFASQSGMFNEVDILQMGLGNFAGTSQHGTGGSFSDRNIARIDQRGNGLSASVSQNGMLNNASIVQR